MSMINADPMHISLRSIGVIAGVLGRAGERGQVKRKALSEEGQVPWVTSPELSRHMETEVAQAKKKRKAVMGRMQLNLQGFNEEEEKILQSQYQSAEVAVDEEAMLGMLGEAATAEDAEEPMHPIVGEIEAHLEESRKVMAKIEERVSGSGVSPVKP